MVGHQSTTTDTTVMAFKFVILAACVAFASAGLIPATYHEAPAQLSYHAAPAQLSYQAAPAAQVSYHAAPAQVSYQAAPAQVSYHSAPAQLAYQAATPVHAYHASPAPLAYHAAAPAPLAYHAPLANAVVTKQIDADYDPHPQYSYGYDVHDSLTGDIKSQQESRDGDVVHGSYSLIEADGSRRTVDYTADSVNGFNAVVHKEPAHVAVKAVHAAPAVVHAAPLVHAAPVAHAPLSYYHH